MSTVSKLRFMKKSTESAEDTTQSKPDISPESLEKWTLSGFETSNLRDSVVKGEPLRKITVAARRSYGGANPYIETIMTSTEKSRKRSREDRATKPDSSPRHMFVLSGTCSWLCSRKAAGTIRYFSKAARKTKPATVQPETQVSESVTVRGNPVEIVANVESAIRVERILSSLPPEAVVAWNIECADVDMKRFHTAGTGGRVLCASCTVKGVDFGNGSQSVFIDALPLSEGTEDDESLEDGHESVILGVFKKYFENPAKLKCSHSVADDYHVLCEHGITLRGVESDTRYLARLTNTALSSWEGSASSSEDTDTTSIATTTVVEKGYDLRSSIASFDIGSSVEFNDKKIDRFLKRLNGPKIAHFSFNMRPYWIGKTVENSVLTLDLHDALKERLEQTHWSSQVVTQASLSMWDLASLVHRPLLQILAQVEHTGMVVNKDFLSDIREKTQALVDEHTASFRNVCASMRDPVDPSSFLNPDADLINPQSPQQIRQLLFGFPSNKQSEWFSYGKKTDGKRIPRSEMFPTPNGPSITISGIGLGSIKSKMNKKRLSDFSAKGLPSVNQKLLLEYAGKDPIGGIFGKAIQKDQLGKFGEEYAKQACIMMYHLANMSKYEYVLSSFVDPLLEKLIQHGDVFKIHPSLSLDTSTGRLACRKPNLHNPPNASDTLGLRAAFAAASGNVLIVADYSQLELRILAHVTNCQSMIKSLRAGGDYHSWTAVDMFPHVKRAIDEGRCTVVSGDSDIPSVKHMFSAERSKAKAVNFSIAYGKCARSIAEDLDCTMSEAEELLANWYASKPEVADWKSDTVFKARVSKKVESILGRTRDIPHIDSRLWKGRSERAAVNHCIQGSAADIAICAMIQIGTDERLNKLGFKLLMQIHDEFIIEGPKTHAEEAKKILVDLMQNPFRTLNPDYMFKVPLEVDAGIGDNWLEAKP